MAAKEAVVMEEARVAAATGAVARVEVVMVAGEMAVVETVALVALVAETAGGMASAK